MNFDRITLPCGTQLLAPHRDPVSAQTLRILRMTERFFVDVACTDAEPRPVQQPSLTN